MKICRKNHILICYETKNLTPILDKVSEEKKNLELEPECPVCKEKIEVGKLEKKLEDIEIVLKNVFA